MQSNKKRIATVKHPTLEAVLSGMFRFQNAEQAIQRMHAIQEYFVISKDQPNNEPAIRIWIKGFAITEEEKEQGYLGNFALIRPRKVSKGKYTITAEKEDVELRLHPQKVRPKRKHPDWGHPVLRNVKKNTIFTTVEEAQEQLMQLHTEYPDVSIPVTGKLYIIIYTRNSKPPVQKFVLEIMVADNGGFYIDSRLNTYDGAKKAPIAVTRDNTTPAGETSAVDEDVQKGYFASMVELKRSKKKRATPLAEAIKKDDTTQQ